jgi:hypothetical protein
MYRSYKFLAKVKATCTGKMLDRLSMNQLRWLKFNVAYCDDGDLKLSTPGLSQFSKARFRQTEVNASILQLFNWIKFHIIE